MGRVARELRIFCFGKKGWTQKTEKCVSVCQPRKALRRDLAVELASILCKVYVREYINSANAIYFSIFYFF